MVAIIEEHKVEQGTRLRLRGVAERDQPRARRPRGALAQRGGELALRCGERGGQAGSIDQHAHHARRRSVEPEQRLDLVCVAHVGRHDDLARRAGDARHRLADPHLAVDRAHAIPDALQRLAHRDVHSRRLVGARLPLLDRGARRAEEVHGQAGVRGGGRDRVGGGVFA